MPGDASSHPAAGRSCSWISVRVTPLPSVPTTSGVAAYLRQEAITRSTRLEDLRPCGPRSWLCAVPGGPLDSTAVHRGATDQMEILAARDRLAGRPAWGISSWPVAVSSTSAGCRTESETPRIDKLPHLARIRPTSSSPVGLMRAHFLLFLMC